MKRMTSWYGLDFFSVPLLECYNLKMQSINALSGKCDSSVVRSFLQYGFKFKLFMNSYEV